MRPFFACLAVLAGVCFATPTQAGGHGGIYAMLEVPALAHNQLTAYDKARPEILRLAAELLPNDGEASTLADFVHRQQAACWGCFDFVDVRLLAAERSPFHLQVHATLAGTSALFERLRLFKGENLRVQALAVRLVADGGAALCRYSDRSFGTKTTVTADWSRLPRAPRADLSLGLGTFVLVLGFFAYLRSRLRRA